MWQTCAESNYHLPWPRGHVQSILDGVTLGATQRVEGDDPAVVEGDQDLEKEVCVADGQVLVEMHVTNWASAQREDPVPDAVLHWLEAKKKTDLKTLLGEHASSQEGQMVWQESSEFDGSPECPLSMTPHPKGRMRIYYSSWCQRHIRLLL